MLKSFSCWQFSTAKTHLPSGERARGRTTRLADGGGVDGDSLLVVGQLAEQCWDSDFLWHSKKIGLLDCWSNGLMEGQH
jgi:hypothetical protein